MPETSFNPPPAMIALPDKPLLAAAGAVPLLMTTGLAMADLTTDDDVVVFTVAFEAAVVEVVTSPAFTTVKFVVFVTVVGLVALELVIVLISKEPDELDEFVKYIFVGFFCNMFVVVIAVVDVVGVAFVGDFEVKTEFFCPLKI